MTRKKQEQLYLIAFVVFLVVLAGFYIVLPNDVPMQYALDGSVNYTLPKLLAVGVMLGLQLLYAGYAKLRFPGTEPYPSKVLFTALILMAMGIFGLSTSFFK